MNIKKFKVNALDEDGAIENAINLLNEPVGTGFRVTNVEWLNDLGPGSVFGEPHHEFEVCIEVGLQMPKTVKQAVCFFVMNDEGKILAISRGKDATIWGLPGGKVEPNESLESAVVREVFEETGYVIASPQSVFTSYVPSGNADGQNFMVTTFVANIVGGTPDAPRSLPYEGDVVWVNREILMFHSPFWNYNVDLFMTIGVCPKKVSDHYMCSYGNLPNLNQKILDKIKRHW
jgi:8-oxo-dGTP pyrophosphatase MutT (NUDIX family)